MEPIHAHHNPFAVVDLTRYLVRRPLDLGLLKALFDGRDRTTPIGDRLHEPPGLCLDVIGQRLYGVRAGKRIHCLGHISLVREHLLGA